MKQRATSNAEHEAHDEAREGPVALRKWTADEGSRRVMIATITHQAVVRVSDTTTICYSKWTDGSVTSREAYFIDGIYAMGASHPAELPYGIEWIDTVALRREIGPYKVSP